MKNRYIFLFILFSNFSFSQCLVTTGADLVSCPDDSIFMGGNLTTSGFTPPLTYAWETHRQWVIGSHTFNYFASDFLDDTTSANPKLISQEEGVLNFKLTVTDVNGLSCSDSIGVHFSNFMYTLADAWNYYITEGDSIWLNGFQNIAGTVPPFQYVWKPSTGLSDSTSLGFWAKPKVTTLYKLQITDSLGCSATGNGSYRVHVNPLSVDEN